MAVYLIPQRSMNFRISHLDGVKDAVKDEADSIASKARARRMAHWDKGHSKITVTQGSVDSFVNLDDTRGEHAAFAIEMGYVTKTGKHVDGLRIIRGAAGLTGS